MVLEVTLDLSNMDFYSFSKFLIKYVKLAQLPEANLYPRTLSIDSRLWNEIEKLKKFTSEYNYEHSITIFDIDGHQIATPAQKGTKESVTSSYKISLRYKLKVRDWYEKQIFINGKLASKFQVKKKDIPPKSQIISLFHIHSHPARERDGGKYYNFFSQVDIKSLLSSRSLCMGLVTDELLIACKSKESPSSLSDEHRSILSKINSDYCRNKSANSYDLDKLGAVFYIGQIGEKLSRMN